MSKALNTCCTEVLFKVNKPIGPVYLEQNVGGGILVKSTKDNKLVAMISQECLDKISQLKFK